jgi:glutaredoxin
MGINGKRGGVAAALVQITNQATVPNVWIDQQFIGGKEETERYLHITPTNRN